MPQLDFLTYPGQIFWLVVSFFLIYFLMSFSVLPKIRGVLQNRKFRKENDLEKAKEYKREAEAILDEYETLLGETKKKAKARIEEMKHRTHQDFLLREAQFTKDNAYRIQQARQKAELLKSDALDKNKDLGLELSHYILQKVIRLR